VFTALLLVVLSAPSATESSSETCLSDTVFYTYASTRCPYCRRLHEFFENTEFRDNYIFCYADVQRECLENYYRFTREAKELPSTGSVDKVIDPILPVPFTIVIKNGTYIVGVVLGLVESRDFWLKLACSSPTREIPLYDGTKQAGALLVNDTVQYNLASLVLSFKPPVEERPAVPGELVVGIVAISIPLIAIGGYYLYTRVLSRAPPRVLSGKSGSSKTTKRGRRK
jgi:hypothetical protein